MKRDTWQVTGDRIGAMRGGGISLVVAQASSPVTVPAGVSPAGPNTNRDGRWDYGSRDGCPTNFSFPVPS